MPERWDDFVKRVVDGNELVGKYESMYKFFGSLLGPNLPELGQISTAGRVEISYNGSDNITHTYLRLRISIDAEFRTLSLRASTGSGENRTTVYEKELPSPDSLTEEEIEDLGGDEILSNIYHSLMKDVSARHSFTDAPSA